MDIISRDWSFANYFSKRETLSSTDLLSLPHTLSLHLLSTVVDPDNEGNHQKSHFFFTSPVHIMIPHPCCEVPYFCFVCALFVVSLSMDTIMSVLLTKGMCILWVIWTDNSSPSLFPLGRLSIVFSRWVGHISNPKIHTKFTCNHVTACDFRDDASILLLSCHTKWRAGCEFTTNFPSHGYKAHSE